jgi:O-antigen/teichoic acid export membrane protein
LLLAYSVRDILWLRLFALASSLIAIPYFFLQPTPLWAAVGWSTLFVAINLFQSWRLFIERRPVKLTPEEEDVRRLAFGDLHLGKCWRFWASGPGPLRKQGIT